MINIKSQEIVILKVFNIVKEDFVENREMNAILLPNVAAFRQLAFRQFNFKVKRRKYKNDKLKDTSKMGKKFGMLTGKDN